MPKSSIACFAKATPAPSASSPVSRSEGSIGKRSRRGIDAVIVGLSYTLQAIRAGRALIVAVNPRQSQCPLADGSGDWSHVLPLLPQDSPLGPQLQHARDPLGS